MTQANTIKPVGRFRSINTKMSLIMAAILFVCVAGMVVFFLIDNLRRSVAAEEQRLNSLGSVYRAVLSEPVSNSDKAVTRDVLRSVRDISTLRQAAVHDASGNLLGEMGGGAVLERTVLESGEFGLFEILAKETVRIESEIMHGGKVVGKLRLIADISWVISQFWLQVTIALIAAALTITFAGLIGNMLIRRASRRLSKLASGLADIGTNDTLAYKFTRESNDEVGILVDAFNDMMGRIHDRDVALRASNENLEKKVSMRTSELVIARDEAQNANAAKSEFLAMMSHEIRTPMNGMMVMAQMLAAAPLSPRHLRFAEIINRSGQNLLSIINDVLDISKIEAGKLSIEATPFAIDDILADIHGLFYERAREKSISISYSVDPSVPEILIGDTTRLNQVITNLVNNALKFTDKGGVIIHASTKATNEGLMLHVSVIDTGIGIREDKLALVFERFAQADQSITRRFGGTGLGLSISKRLVEAMGGEISVKSREGHGSTFAFQIGIEADAKTEPDAWFTGTRIKVLMNNAIHQQVLVESLIAHGARVSTDADEARYEILLSDDAQMVDQSKRTALFLEQGLDATEAGYRSRGRLVLALPASRKQISQLARAAEAQDFSSLRASSRTSDRLRTTIEFRGLRALAVDDNTVNREVLLEALSSMQIETDTAVNGEEALAKAKAKNYDIIFMDCSMPVMDGYTATRRLRDREKGTDRRVPIVAITALTERGGREDWRSAGMDGWISKPFTIPAVAARITSLVLKHEGETQEQPVTNENQNLTAKYEAMPLLDEQTVSMITRLGSKGPDPAVRRIRDLFVVQTNNAIEDLSAAGLENLEQVEDVAHMMQSIALSIGATRLSAMAAHIVERAKSGRLVEAEFVSELRHSFEASDQAIAARFGLAASKSPRLAAKNS
jgi:signal transduction histidine kinase/CheY-like chemotaxis protein